MTAETVEIARPQEAMRRRSSGERLGRVVVTAGLGVAAVYFLLPVAWLTIAATKDTSSLFGSFGLALDDPRPVANLRDLFAYADGIYLRWMLNSVIYAGGGALAATLLAAAAGYALGKYRFRGREALFSVVLGGVLVPATVLGLPLYLMLSKVGLANTYWAVLLPSMISPFGVYLCRIYAEAAVPDELIEAARVDGAGELTIFRRISLRIMTPALVTVFLFQFVGIWNNYFLPLVMLSDDRLYPITLGLTTWQGFADRQPVLYQMVVVGAFVSTVPLVVAVAVLQRYWRGGLTQGSVKG
jgi:multiple sugar transport system permease protein